MKKGVSMWAFADNDPKVMFPKAKAYGFEGVELCMDFAGPVRPDCTKEELDEIKALAQENGLELYSVASGVYWGNSLTADDADERARTEQLVKSQVDIAAYLGCDTILILPGLVAGFDKNGPVVPYDVVYARALDAVKRLAPYAEEKKVKLGLENVWNKFLLSPMEMRDFIDAVGSEYVGCYFDVGNVMQTGYPQHWIRLLGNRIAKVHFKDFNVDIGNISGFCDLLEGDVNYPEVMTAFAEIGYDGWVTAEVFPDAADPEKVLQVNSAAMDRILAR